MIEIKFKIEELPSDQSQPYSLVAGVEGVLTVVNDGETVFEEPGILLLELSQALTKWVDEVSSGKDVDFYYASMDFEEEPILTFTCSDTDSQYEVKSVWIKSESSSNRSELIAASKSYVKDLDIAISG
ncbi:MAG: hypothetical protein CSA49_07765 [Gammaproteobacteria bacterium]|nr:MAG: hypothetical protein CSA49_07765 [Gammaproteobacteria bacterium]